MNILTLKGFSGDSSEQVVAAVQSILQISDLEASSLLTTFPSEFSLETSDQKQVEEIISKLKELGIESEIKTTTATAASTSEKIAESVTEIEFSFDEESDVSIESSPSKSAPPVYTVGENADSTTETNGSVDPNLLGEIEQLVTGLQTSPLKKSETGLYASLQSELSKFNEDRKLSDFIASAKTEETNFELEEPRRTEPVKKTFGYRLQLFLRSKQGQRRIKELAGVLGVGLLIVLMAMPFMNQDEVVNRKNSMKAFVEQLISLVETRHVKKDNSQQQKISTNAFFVGNGESNNKLKYSAMFNFRDKFLDSITLLYSAPPPAPLTDEEIVNRVRSRPWLKKIDLSQLVIENKEDGNFVASGQARLVINQDAEARLFTGLAVVTGKHDGVSNELEVKVLVNKGFQSIPGENYIFEYNSETDSNEDLKVYISDNLKIRYSEDVELLKALSDDLSSQLSSVMLP